MSKSDLISKMSEDERAEYSQFRALIADKIEFVGSLLYLLSNLSQCDETVITLEANRVGPLFAEAEKQLYRILAELDEWLPEPDNIG